MVDPHYYGDILTGGRCGNNDSFGARLQMEFGFFPGGKKTGRFKDYIDFLLFPGEFFRVSDGKYLNRFTINYQFICRNFNLTGENPVYRIIFKQVSKRLCVGQVIYRDYFNTLLPERRTQHHSPDSAK